MKQAKPAYRKLPKDTCDLCGVNLYLKLRYRVKLYLKSSNPLLARTPYKTLTLCQECLAKIRGSPQVTRLFRVKYKRMPTLGEKNTTLGRRI